MLKVTLKGHLIEVTNKSNEFRVVSKLVSKFIVKYT